MSIRKFRRSWWVDFCFDRTRYRKKSPENSRAGALAYESLLRQKLVRGESLDDEKEKVPTLKEFSTKWQEIYVRNNNKPSEQRQKEYTFRVHLNPILGKLPLDKIPMQKIEEYKSIKIKSGLRNKTINNHLTILAKCLRTAVDWEIIDKIPKIVKLKVAPYESEFLSQEECDLLLAHAKGIWYEMILFALRTGMRLGELTGLDWSAVDLKEKRVSVVRALVRDQIVSPKSNKIRHIPLTDEVCQVLNRREKKSGFVFVDENGDFLKAERCRRNLHFICDRAGMKRAKWHTMRHTFASHLIQLGAHQIEVQRLLGHSDIQTTMRYSHLAPSSLRKAIDLLDPNKGTESFRQHLGNTPQNGTKMETRISNEKVYLFPNIK